MPAPDEQAPYAEHDGGGKTGPYTDNQPLRDVRQRTPSPLARPCTREPVSVARVISKTVPRPAQAIPPPPELATLTTPLPMFAGRAVSPEDWPGDRGNDATEGKARASRPSSIVLPDPRGAESTETSMPSANDVRIHDR